MIATPLILVNVGRLLHLSLGEYMMFSTLDLCMITFGYISYIASTDIIVDVFYGLGGLCYIALIVLFVRKLKMCSSHSRLRNALPPTSIYRDSVRYRIFRCILLCIACSWSVYPIAHMLYKQGVIDKQTVVIVYILMDILSKGIFTSLLLGSREIYQTRVSWLGIFTKKAFQIHPLEVSMSDNSLQESIAQSKQIHASEPQVFAKQPNSQQSHDPLKTSEPRVNHIPSVYVHSSSTTGTTVLYAPTLESIVEEPLT